MRRARKDIDVAPDDALRDRVDALVEGLATSVEELRRLTQALRKDRHAGPSG